MNFILFIIKCLLYFYLSAAFYYLLFLIFNRFKKYKLALACLNYSLAAVLSEKKAKRIACYCKEYCLDKVDCKNCRYWSCYGKENLNEIH